MLRHPGIFSILGYARLGYRGVLSLLYPFPKDLIVESGQAVLTSRKLETWKGASHIAENWVYLRSNIPLQSPKYRLRAYKKSFQTLEAS